MGGSLQNTVSLLSSHVVSLCLNILLAWHALTVLGVDKTSWACNLSRVSKQSFSLLLVTSHPRGPSQLLKTRGSWKSAPLILSKHRPGNSPTLKPPAPLLQGPLIIFHSQQRL